MWHVTRRSCVCMCVCNVSAVCRSHRRVWHYVAMCVAMLCADGCYTLLFYRRECIRFGIWIGIWISGPPCARGLSEHNRCRNCLDNSLAGWLTDFNSLEIVQRICVGLQKYGVFFLPNSKVHCRASLSAMLYGDTTTTVCNNIIYFVTYYSADVAAASFRHSECGSSGAIFVFSRVNMPWLFGLLLQAPSRLTAEKTTTTTTTIGSCYFWVFKMLEREHATEHFNKANSNILTSSHITYIRTDARKHTRTHERTRVAGEQKTLQHMFN